MTLQLALDGAEKGRTLDEAMALARAARQYTDVIEVGTSFVLRRREKICARWLRRAHSCRCEDYGLRRRPVRHGVRGRGGHRDRDGLRL